MGRQFRHTRRLQRTQCRSHKRPSHQQPIWNHILARHIRRTLQPQTRPSTNRKLHIRIMLQKRKQHNIGFQRQCFKFALEQPLLSILIQHRSAKMQLHKFKHHTRQKLQLLEHNRLHIPKQPNHKRWKRHKILHFYNAQPNAHTNDTANTNTKSNSIHHTQPNINPRNQANQHIDYNWRHRLHNTRHPPHRRRRNRRHSNSTSIQWRHFRNSAYQSR